MIEWSSVRQTSERNKMEISMPASNIEAEIEEIWDRMDVNWIFLCVNKIAITMELITISVVRSRFSERVNAVRDLSPRMHRTVLCTVNGRSIRSTGINQSREMVDWKWWKRKKTSTHMKSQRKRWQSKRSRPNTVTAWYIKRPFIREYMRTRLHGHTHRNCVIIT